MNPEVDTGRHSISVTVFLSPSFPSFPFVSDVLPYAISMYATHEAGGEENQLNHVVQEKILHWNSNTIYHPFLWSSDINRSIHRKKIYTSVY